MRRTTIHLGDTDRVAIRRIRERYGVDTDSSAIRLALRVLADADYLQIPFISKQESSASTKSNA